MVKNLPAVRETWVRSLGREDPLEDGMATHSYSCLENPLEQRSLAGHSPRGHKELDTAERLSRAHTALRAMHYAECFSHMIYITFYLMFPIYQQGSHAHFADEENLRLRRPGQLPRFQNHKVTALDMKPRLI